MATKIKKISDLDIIRVNNSTKLETCNFIANDGILTGKISGKDIVAIVNSIVSSNNTAEAKLEEIKTLVNSIDVETKAVKSSVTTNASKISTVEKKVTELSKEIKKVSDKVDAQSSVATCNCDEKIAALESKISALEGFVQALQKDGYLTLAEIRKAATEACPICNHTHEEQSSAE